MSVTFILDKILELSLSLSPSLYILSSTDRLFVLSELFSMARHAGRSKPGSKPIQLYVRLSLRPLGIYVATAVASVGLHFYTLSATRVLNSFEELCIMRAAADNSFARVLYCLSEGIHERVGKL